MARKYASDVDDAISAALARGEQPSQIYDQLTRGTLDGLSQPRDMPRRTFRYKVQRIRERMVAERRKPERRCDLGDGRRGTLAEALAEAEAQEARGHQDRDGAGRAQPENPSDFGERRRRGREFARKLAAEHDLDITF